VPTWLVWQQEGHLVCKKLGAHLLMMIWSFANLIPPVVTHHLRHP